MNDMTGTGAVLPAVKEPTSFPAMLKAYQSEIARALPKHMDGDRMARIALTEFRKNPTLGKCEPKSVFAASGSSAQSKNPTTPQPFVRASRSLSTQAPMRPKGSPPSRRIHSRASAWRQNGFLRRSITAENAGSSMGTKGAWLP